jgi:hypothetical protein
MESKLEGKARSKLKEELKLERSTAKLEARTAKLEEGRI